MIRVAWWSCALLALACARVYERCELARELRTLGVQEDHISTWVCIAYHESRFDTAAQNYGSGDHGIFQISELYWCGRGKACGLPCSALRDEIIDDDLKCALQVHEEHTRLQGNGFLAWVVYPQHCKHNTKKYLAECDNTQIAKPVVTHSKSRVSYNDESDDTNTNFTSRDYNQNIDNLLPPYLSISSIFRGSYGKELDHAKYSKDRETNWLNYKIDNIDELKLPIKEQGTTRSTSPTPTTTTTYIPPVVPWRRIETNQFRKKVISEDKISTKAPLNKGNTPVDSNPPSSSTYRPTTNAFKLPTITSTTTQKLPLSTSTYKPLTFGYTFQGFSTTTSRPSTTTQTYKTTTPTTTRPSTRTISTTKQSTVTTTESSTKSLFKSPSTSPWIFTTRTFKPVSTTTTQKPVTTTTRKPTTTKSTTKYIPRYTFTSRAITNATTTTLSPIPKWTTLQPLTTYKPSTVKQIDTTKSPEKIRQSVFDFYLNPTRPPTLSTYRFDWNSDHPAKLYIFSGGTTTPVPSLKSVKEFKTAGDAAKNYVRRQT